MIQETYVRTFVEAHQLEESVAFYRRMLSGTETLRFHDSALDLRLVAVSSTHLSVLIIAGDEAARRPFESTRLTVRVDDLDSAYSLLAESGATVVDRVQTTPVGRKMRWRHVDGMVVEYVDHVA